MTLNDMLSLVTPGQLELAKQAFWNDASTWRSVWLATLPANHFVDADGVLDALALYLPTLA